MADSLDLYGKVNLIQSKAVAQHGLPGEERLARVVKHKDAWQSSCQGVVGVWRAPKEGLHKHQISIGGLHPLLKASHLVTANQACCTGQTHRFQSLPLLQVVR